MCLGDLVMANCKSLRMVREFRSLVVSQIKGRLKGAMHDVQIAWCGLFKMSKRSLAEKSISKPELIKQNLPLATHGQKM